MKTLIFISSILFTSQAFSLDSEKSIIQKDNNQNIEYRKQCIAIRDQIVSQYAKEDQYKIDCRYNYHHFNSNAFKQNYSKKKVKAGEKIRISNFNLWHPGKKNTRFKDLKLVAQIMDQYDLVAGLELLPNVSEDAAITMKVSKKLNALLLEQVQTQRRWNLAWRSPDVRQELGEKLDQMKKEISELRSVLKKPGYLKILDELRKIDKSWALILSPRGEAAKASDVHELVGYYYRSKKVRPIQNGYCRQYVTLNKGRPYACIPRFTKSFMGDNYRHVFSRRPFMASFEAGEFDFTLLASHVVFNSPTDAEKQTKILQSAFNVESLDDLPRGINKQNYARFAEVKVMMEFMKKLKASYGEKDVILAGDFNLENSNKFWPEMLENHDELNVLVDGKTSVSEVKHSEGYASNYDHFIVDTNESTECDLSTAKVFNFLEDKMVNEYLTNNYLIREFDLYDGFMIFPTLDAKAKIRSKSEVLEQQLKNEKKISRGKIKPRYTDEKLNEVLHHFKRRIFGSQFSVDSYYRVYKELVSDHAPIEIDCATNMKDTDTRK